MSSSRGIQLVDRLQHVRPGSCCRRRQATTVNSSKKGNAPRQVVVGIDLGTTNSAVAYVENGKPRCIPNGDGDRITPSVVTFLPDGSAAVGKRARQLAATHPSTSFYSVKRLIGRTFEDPVVQEELSRVAYPVCPATTMHRPKPCTQQARFVLPKLSLGSMQSLYLAAPHVPWRSSPGAHALPCPRAPRLPCTPCFTHATGWWPQVSKDGQGLVTLPCPAVSRGFIYPEEVSAQVPHVTAGQGACQGASMAGRCARCAG